MYQPEVKFKIMKWFIKVFALVLLSTACQTSEENQYLVKDLEDLLDRKQVFQAQRIFLKEKENLPEVDRLMFSSHLENSFNHSASSNTSINRLIDNYSDQIDPKQMCDLLQLKLQNHVRLFEYEQSAQVNNDLLKNYSNLLDSTTLADLGNTLNIWSGLSGQAAQRVIKKEHSKIELIGGSRIKTNLNNSDTVVNMTFDTGANISVLIESLADATNLEYMDASVGVTGILGNETMAKVAIASSMKFGNIELENVVFLVFPDSALYYEAANFQIYGIMGYPVISALGEIHRTTDNYLIIPSEPTKTNYANLAMEFLTPVVEVFNEQDTMLFTFDTGAGKTLLYEKYYQRAEESIKAKYEKTNLVIGGVGAVQNYEGYLIDFLLQIGGMSLDLDSTKLLSKNIDPEHDFYDGNLGQDVIGAFDKMILNFEDMFVAFSNN